ncbi:OmpA family protein [Aliikangiella sp. IMCC44359]|uniref:OmpA family protein n=1 Tax=Aliikangiella sp. IMCC44359 TaxID=3459125 RepID=UPI00403ADB12
MKKFIAFASIMTASLSFTAQAFDDEVTGPYFSLGANHFIFDGARLLNDDTDLFIGLGTQITNNWSFGAEYTRLQTERSWTGGSDFDTHFYSISSSYRFKPRNQNSFFWKLGVGNYTEAPETNHGLATRLGAGYDFSLGEKTSFTIGADALSGINKGRLDWVPYVSLNYFFGDVSKRTATVVQQPVATKPQDSDNDGVININDQCPNTAANVEVDSIGCELDSDQDGVVNSHDQCLQTPAGAKVDANGCRVILTEDVSIKLNVQFANNSNAISGEYNDEINKVAEFMRQYPDTNVTIEGHTDSRGSAKYNQQLSQKRAEAVMNYLVNNLSVSADRISAIGKGEESPIADNDTAEGRKANRRVQAEIKTTVSKPQ